ncbi:MAG: ATP-binding protein, partial [Cellvibrionaceae bacterium]
LVATYSNTLIGVFENVLGNALHYTRPNTTISITLRQRNDNYIVAIADQGPGVREEHLKDIFEPFYRTDEARDRASGGYGLGLSIAQRTVQLHGGTITAHNHPEGGLVVEVILPRTDFESVAEETELPPVKSA